MTTNLISSPNLEYLMGTRSKSYRARDMGRATDVGRLSPFTLAELQEPKPRNRADRRAKAALLRRHEKFIKKWRTL